MLTHAGQHLRNQSKVRVAEQSLVTTSGDVRFVALAAFLASVFYFYSFYYFWGSWGGALTGG
jgi:hypothetical protein